MNYRGPDHSIYQAPVLYQVQSSLQAIAYFNLRISISILKSSTSTLASIPNGLLASSLASSWCICTILICLMIPDVHLQRSLHLIKSNPGLHTSSGLGVTGLLPRRPSSFLSGTLTFLKTKLTSAQGWSPSYVQQGFHPHRHQVMLEGAILHASTSGWSARRSTTWIIRTSVGRSIILLTYVLEEAIYHKLVAPPIQWEGWLRRLIQKVDSKSWFKRLIRKSEMIRKVR